MPPVPSNGFAEQVEEQQIRCRVLPLIQVETLSLPALSRDHYPSSLHQVYLLLAIFIRIESLLLNSAVPVLWYGALPMVLIVMSLRIISPLMPPGIHISLEILNVVLINMPMSMVKEPLTAWVIGIY